tara:strand:- start:28 stop:174 length:147 start_codon:yes stop_codon:yes gene_type:complete
MSGSSIYLTAFMGLSLTSARRNPAINALLLEDGFFLLQEDGFSILLES